MANGKRRRMQHIVIIAKNKSMATNLYSIAKILFPETEIHLLINNINNDKMKEVHMTCENLFYSKK